MSKHRPRRSEFTVDVDGTVVQEKTSKSVPTLDAVRSLVSERQQMREEARLGRRLGRFLNRLRDRLRPGKGLEPPKSPKKSAGRPRGRQRHGSRRSRRRAGFLLPLLGSLPSAFKRLRHLVETEPVWSLGACLVVALLITAMFLPYTYGPPSLSGADSASAPPPAERHHARPEGAAHPKTPAKTHPASERLLDTTEGSTVGPDALMEAGASAGVDAASIPAVGAGTSPLQASESSGPADIPSLSSSSAAPSSEGPEAADATGSFRVQVATFSVSNNAERVADFLRAQSHEVEILVLAGNLHLVQVGPFRERTAADAAAEAIGESMNLTPLVIRSPGQ